MINLTDKLTAKTVQNILGESKEIAYQYGDENMRVSGTVATTLNRYHDQIMEGVVLGDQIAGPGATDWQQGTVEQYIDDRIHAQDVAINEKLALQQDKINTLNGNEVVMCDTTSDRPATGSVGIIYRVSSDPDAHHYTDYMWDLKTNSYKTLATYEFPGIDDKPTKNSDNLVSSGGVFDEITTNGSAFDITAYYSGTTYSGFTQALNAVPSDYRKGGMSVKYVQSSDNKYVQYRLTSDTFTTNESEWEKQGAEVSVSQNTLYIGGIPSGEVGIFESSLIGDNNNYVTNRFSTIEGHKYQVSMIDTQWPHSSTSAAVLRIVGIKDGSIIDTVASQSNTPIKNDYIFTAKDCDYYVLGIRADLSNRIRFYIDDVTLVSQVSDNLDSHTREIAIVEGNMRVNQIRLIDGANAEDITSIESYTKYDGGISTADKWVANGKHIVIPVVAGNTIFSASVNENSPKNLKYAFVKNYIEPTIDTSPLYCDGTRVKFVTIGKRGVARVSDDANYIIICTNAEGEDVIFDSIRIQTTQQDSELLQIDNEIRELKEEEYSFQETITRSESGIKYFNFRFIRGGKYRIVVTDGALDGGVHYLAESASNMLQSITFIDNISEFVCNFDNALYARLKTASAVTINVYAQNLDTLQIKDLNDEVCPNLNSADLWEQGTLSNSQGTPKTSSYRIRTKEYISQNVEHIKVSDGYKVYIYAYLNDDYIGVYNGSDFGQTMHEIKGNIDFGKIRRNFPYYRYKLLLFISTTDAITTADWDNIKLYSYLYNELRKINTNHPILTFIDDDGWAEQFENWERIYNECGIIPSMALITSSVTQEKWNTIERLNNLGFDFISHTHNHLVLEELTEQEMIEDFEATIAALREHKCNSQLLVYPHNKVNNQVIEVVKKYFMAGFGGQNKNNSLPLNKYNIKRHTFFSDTRTTVVTIDGVDYTVKLPKTNEEYDAILDAGLKYNGWVIFMTHFRTRYSSDGTAGIFNDEVIESVKHICEYALSKGYKIMTAHDAYLTLRNQFESDTKVVDCNNIFYNLG